MLYPQNSTGFGENMLALPRSFRPMELGLLSIVLVSRVISIDDRCYPDRVGRLATARGQCV